MKHYFVDEAGDPVLFNRRGKVVVGTEGCSRFFIVGFLDAADPIKLGVELDQLRRSLLSDPYFKKIPSMQPDKEKTALGFHAKDDVPEVRREVYRLLIGHKLRFCAEIQDKLSKAHWVKNTNTTSPRYHYNQNSMYDGLVARLFKNHLHKDDAYEICFAKRGESDRTKALGKALQKARGNFRKKWGIDGNGIIEVTMSKPSKSAGLQAADYFLWALQRCYEKQEDRYIRYIWNQVCVVHDIDDQRTRKTGVYYTKEQPLLAEKLPELRKKEGREI